MVVTGLILFRIRAREVANSYPNHSKRAANNMLVTYRSLTPPQARSAREYVRESMLFCRSSHLKDVHDGWLWIRERLIEELIGHHNQANG